MMLYWDRCEGLHVMDDLLSGNPNRATFGESRVILYADAEAKSGTKSSLIRDLLPIMRTPELLRGQDPLLRPERHFNPARGREVLMVLLMELIGEEVDTGRDDSGPLLHDAQAALKEAVSSMPAVSLRRFYLEEGGPMQFGSPPLRLAIRALLKAIDVRVASGDLSAADAARAIDGVKMSAAIFIESLVSERGAQRSLFEFKNPYVGQFDLSPKPRPRGSA